MVFPKLSRSSLRQKVLLYFFVNPHAELYLREIASTLKVDPGNLSKELVRLEKEGVFVSHLRGKQKYYALNRAYPLYKELKSVVFKTIGVESRLKDIANDIKGIKTAFIYGSFASETTAPESDIDVMIIGDPDEDRLAEIFDRLEKETGREINYNVYPEEEFYSRLKKKDSFIKNILAKRIIKLKGDIDETR